jgi:diguanylate cyclase (GGDEF)-like protein
VLKPKILVVDDVAVNATMLAGALKQRYHVAVAKNGREALQEVLSDPPDLVLLDIVMPDIDGYEVCVRIKSNPATRHIPIIFTTAKDELEDELRGLELGAADYITKPFQLPIVLARVRTHIELKLKTDALEQQGSNDGLTGIANRRAFDRKLDVEWRRTCRSETALSLIMCDIDYFKRYNDHFGHLQGDTCLIQVAQMIAAQLHRPADLAARFGGEEFAVLLPETPSEGANHIAGLIKGALAAHHIPHPVSDAAPHVTLSIGVATVTPDRQRNPELLLQTADKLLYRAKECGRNRIESCDLDRPSSAAAAS